jgi:hypothetical protein
MWARVKGRTENALLQVPFARRKRLVAWWGISRFYQTLCRPETINRWLALAAQWRALRVPTLPPSILVKLTHIPPAIHGNALPRHVVVQGKHDGDSSNVLH